MKWRDECLKAEVRESDFWGMTIGEAVRACDAYVERRKEQAYFAYTNAMTVGMFVGSMFGSRKPPTIHEIYPELFPKQEDIEEERRMDASAANFIKFANSFNQRYNNGNRKLESKNNG